MQRLIAFYMITRVFVQAKKEKKDKVKRLFTTKYNSKTKISSDHMYCCRKSI